MRNTETNFIIINVRFATRRFKDTCCTFNYVVLFIYMAIRSSQQNLLVKYALPIYESI